jgi:hypothetical protein
MATTTKPAAKIATAKPPAKPADKPVIDNNDTGSAMVVGAAANANVPAFLQGKVGPARGSENVTAVDLVIPRLELVQALSPCLHEGKIEYIEGAKAGMLYNNVTRELYGYSVSVIPVFFKKEFIVWVNRKKVKGGGFVGAFSSEAEAEDCLSAQEVPDNHQINDTANHFCLLVNPATGLLEEIVVSMAVTKLKVSRTWNSLVRINGGDSFSRRYTLAGVDDQNKAGEEYKNFSIKNGGWVTEDEYKRAEALYETVRTGAATINRDIEAETADNDAGSAPAEY